MANISGQIRLETAVKIVKVVRGRVVLRLENGVEIGGRVGDFLTVVFESSLHSDNRQYLGDMAAIGARRGVMEA